LTGLWIGDTPPDIIFKSGGIGPLVVGDHTLIMKAIMEHPTQVFRSLPDKYKSKTGGNPSGKEVLQAALEVEQIDDYTKDRIRAVLDLLPKIEAAQADAPVARKKALDDLRQQLANKTIEEQQSLLRNAARRSRNREDGLAEGMEVAARILDDGQDTIYSPDHSFYKLLQEGQGTSRTAARDALSDIGSADTIGGAAGGAVGAAVGGVGAGPGAVGASAGAVGYHMAGFAVYLIRDVWPF
jgi:hypothetical protein